MPTWLIVVIIIGGIIAAMNLAAFALDWRDRRAEAARERTYPESVRRRTEAGPGRGGGVDTPPWEADAQRRRREARGGDDRTLELVEELRQIGRRRGFLSLHSGKDRRTREIGAELHALGGKRKMRYVHDKVRDDLGQVFARELEAAWDGVGDWLG